MQALTLAQLFGASAVQTATQLVIQKPDLVAVGLTPKSKNTAESLLVAILRHSLENFEGYLCDEIGNRITDQNGQFISYDNKSLYLLLEMFYWGVFVPEEYTDRIRQQIIIYSYTNEI
ncbi:hypothetical protein [Nostoc sp. 2RC]|uniref:hypothetical protein n=1 Tax=Nostoc sp. 2RC TaxID=2485484 RepID=UPI001625E933|nr:hypothetical protein [Nostoc sp. 2RC]MBC1242071.1 hypothetical protein [Nostoc sp. 2RC]